MSHLSVVVPVGNDGSTPPRTAVYRFTTEGRLDTTFSTDGTILNAFISSTGNGRASARYSNDQVLVMTYGTGDGLTSLVRLKTDGALDTSFFTDGERLEDFTDISATGEVITTPNDKLLMAGSKGGLCQLARFNTDGDLDTSFATDGVFGTSVGSVAGRFVHINRLNGKIIVSGNNGTSPRAISVWP